MTDVYFLEPLLCHACGETTGARETNLMSSWYHDHEGISVRRGELIPDVSFSDLRDLETHLVLRKPMSGEVITTLEKWSCQTVLASGDRCLDVSDEKTGSFARVELRPVDGGLVFDGVESVLLTRETLESVHLIDLEFGHWFENDPTGYLTSILTVSYTHLTLPTTPYV